jgi:hypothetical protein
MIKSRNTSARGIPDVFMNRCASYSEFWLPRCDSGALQHVGGGGVYLAHSQIRGEGRGIFSQAGLAEAGGGRVRVGPLMSLVEHP